MRSVLRQLNRAAQGLGGFLFLLLFLTFLIQITARFIFNRPLPWTDELAVVLYLWVILWAAAFMVPEREHVVFDLIWNGSPPWVRRIMKFTGHALLGGLALVAIPANWDYVRFMAREKTPVLDVPFMWVFLPFVLLLFALVVKSLWGIWQAIQGEGLEINEVKS